MGDDKPKKVKISKTTGKKLRAIGSNPPAEKAGLLKAIADALRKKNQGGSGS